MLRKTRLLGAIVLAFGLLASDARACPLCKEAVAAQDDLNVAEGKPTTFTKYGYNYSVLFMMAMPFALLSTGTFFVVRAVKRGALPEL